MVISKDIDYTRLSIQGLIASNKMWDRDILVSLILVDMMNRICALSIVYNL